MWTSCGFVKPPENCLSHRTEPVCLRKETAAAARGGWPRSLRLASELAASLGGCCRPGRVGVPRQGLGTLRGGCAWSGVWRSLPELKHLSCQGLSQASGERGVCSNPTCFRHHDKRCGRGLLNRYICHVFGLHKNFKNFPMVMTCITLFGLAGNVSPYYMTKLRYRNYSHKWYTCCFTEISSFVIFLTLNVQR